LPQYNEFRSENPTERETIHLSLDEYETIRLLDWEGCRQEECAVRMQISRTSVTAIYDSARHKIADAMVNGRTLYITGGNCKMEEPQNNKICCRRHGHNGNFHCKNKGENEMRLAVAYENGEVFQHFGRTPFFKLYDVKDGKILESVVISSNGSGHGALAGILATAQVDAVICGGMGMGAQYALKDAGIQVFAGASGDADEAVKAFLNGTLHYTQDANCEHHHEEGEECSCGEHEEGCGCGGHEDGGCACGCHS